MRKLRDIFFFLLFLSFAIAFLIGVFYGIAVISNKLTCTDKWGITKERCKEVEQQEQVIETPVAGEEVKTKYELERDALIQKYSALEISDYIFSFAHQYQDLYDTSAFFAVWGIIDGVIQEKDQLVMIVGFSDILYQGSIGGTALRATIPSELFNARSEDFTAGNAGCFIVEIQNTFVHLSRQRPRYDYDDETSDRGSPSHLHLDTIIFVQANLIDLHTIRKQHD